MEYLSSDINKTKYSVLILGKGAREKVIKEKLLETKQHSNILIYLLDIPEKNNYFLIVEFCKKKKIDLVIPSTEIYLCNGIHNIINDALKHIMIFGPTKQQALIEGSKIFSKTLMKDLDLPTANFKFYTDRFPCFEDFSIYENKDKDFYNKIVIKYSGLAAGKGVYLPSNKYDAINIIDNLFNSNKKKVLIEDRLEGIEVSVLAFCNGYECSLMPQAQDYKRIYNDDKGPNTGGMGAISPVDILTEDEIWLVNNYMNRIVSHLNYKGILYAGLMKTREGIFFLEFNCRFGDPETQVVLNLLDDDLCRIITDCIMGNKLNIRWKNKSAATVVLSHVDYPYSKSKHKLEIKINEKIDDTISIYESNVMLEKKGKHKDKTYTTGGRVLSMVSVNDTIGNALDNIYNNISKIQYDGIYYRTDIGKTYFNYIINSKMAIKKQVLNDVEKEKEKEKKLTYNVNIEEGNDFVSELKKSNPYIGGFCSEYNHNGLQLVASADGCGTKIELSQKYNKLNTIGIDVVAMNVNDIIAGGGNPLFFMDYISLDKMDKNKCLQVIQGINRGCSIAKCPLIGGETAEMKGMYKNNKLDVAGFCVGEKKYNVLKKNEMKMGSIIYGIPSNGIHSNGYTLVREILDNMEMNGEYISNKLIEELLVPTRIYTDVLKLYEEHPDKILGVAHITGGGYKDNITRIIPDNLTYKLDNWELPEIFQWIKVKSNLTIEEMRCIFNCGYGMIVISNDNLPLKKIGVLVN